MNIRKYFKDIPQDDSFLDIHIEERESKDVFPDYTPCTEYCICLYGKSESEIETTLLSVRAKADTYTNKLRELFGNEVAWDVMCKPICLFENKECTFLFTDFANLLSEDDFWDFISEFQLDYNEPWTHVQLIDHAHLCEIIDHYERRFGYGFCSI